MLSLGAEATVIDRPSFRQRLEALLDRARRAERRQDSAVHGRTAALARRLRHIDHLVADWMRRIVVPRLRSLAAAFPHSRGVTLNGSGACAELILPPTEAYPADVRVRVCLRPDDTLTNLEADVQVLMLPVLLAHRSGGTRLLPIEKADTTQLEEFLDEHLLAFAEDYVRLRAPDSPYQAERTVTDPVCGRRLRVDEAAASVGAGDRRRYFCSVVCAARGRERAERGGDTG